MVAIIGIGTTAFGRHPDRTIVQMATEAISMALADAEIGGAAVGAGFFANALGARLFGDLTIGQNVFAELGMTRIAVTNVENACTSGSTAFWNAYNAIAADQADIAIVAGAEKMCVPGFGLISSGDSEFDTKLGMVAPAGFGMRAMRHMHEFGTTRAQLAMVTVKSRAQAALNPLAQFRVPTTVEEVLAAPMIADPLTRPQCSPIADGASAVVLAKDSVARGSPRAIRVAAAILASGSYEQPVDLVRWETDRRVAALAYEKAGIGPDDLDAIECHDAFSIAELLHYEALGLCPVGDAGALIESGATSLGGRIPVNVSGGLLSRGHPIAATAVAQIVELARQLRGEAGPSQIAGAKTALAHCLGGDRAGDAKSATAVILTR